MNASNLYAYQQYSVQHILNNNAAGLFLDMGLGKTVSTLTAIDILINDRFEVSKVLVIAPKRVAEDTWTTECEKWEHLRHLRISKVLGSQVARKAALKVSADIYVINRENVEWLVTHYGVAFPFDMVVIDELSSFKSAKANRFKALRKVRPKVNRVVGLTGTPAPNSLLDLWPQLFLLDMGERLCKTITEYRNQYFRVKNPYASFPTFELISDNNPDHGPDYYAQRIYDLIGDICISMKARDYLELPPAIYRTTEIHLSAEQMEKYEEFEKTQVLQLLDDNGEISAPNAAALSNKLLQYASGAIYGQDRAVFDVHSAKLDMLDEMVEAANGKPVLIAYWFQHERDRILEKLKRFKPTVLESSEHIRMWNEGKIKVLLGHPMSMGHGLNIQHGGSYLIWFGPTWSLENYQQTNGRLDRQGQKADHVMIQHLIVKGTMDERAMAALDTKQGGQAALMEGVKAVIKKYI